MELVLLKNPLTISAKTLKTLINTFKDYTKKPVYPPDDEKAYDESQAAADLINEAIYQVTVAIDELKKLVAQIKKEYERIQDTGEREDFSDALEKLEDDTNFNEILGAGTEIIFMLRARLTEVISTRNRLGRKLGLTVPTQPNPTAVTNGNFIQNNDNEQQEISEDNGWITENSNDSTDVESSTINNDELSGVDDNGANNNGDPPDIGVDAANPPTGHQDPPQSRPPRQATINARTIIRNFERSLEESDEADEGYSRASTPIRQMLFSVITALCLINPVASDRLICEKGNIKINNPNTTFELCMGSLCRSFPKMAIAEREWSLPPTALNKTMFVSMRYFLEDQEIMEQAYCVQPHICDHSKGFLSKKLLANPHCWPNGAIASLGLALYAIIVTTIMLSTCIKRLLIRPVQVTVNTSDNASVRLELFSPPTIYRAVNIALVCILALTDAAAACQNGHIRQEIDLICTSHNSCSYEYKREILFNELDLKLCVNIMHANKSVGLIEVERYPTIMRCAKRSLYFTRDATTRVFSTVRCSQAGSCVNSKCSQTTVNTTIKELGKAYQFPGYSGCQHSCGGLGCGCFLPLPACSFYRVTQIPRNEEIYEVVSCLKWEPLVNLKVRVSLYNQEKETFITSAPYIKHEFQGMEISIISVQSPHFSMLDRKIAISNKEALLLPEGYELAAKCATYQSAAKDFKNCANQMICSCEDANGAIKCHCPQMSIRDVKNDITNVFPIHTPFTSLQKRDKELFVKTMQGEVVVSLESRSLKNSAEYLLEQDCKLNASSVFGCYDCQEGAQVNISCTTNERAWIVIQCGEHTFSVECDSQGKETALAIEFQKAIVQETCVAQCNNKTIKFDLTGTLSFVPDIVEHMLFENPAQLRNSHKDWFADWKVPSILPIWNTLCKHWQVTTVILGSITILSVITYSSDQH
ncbi:unnamed protein product [Cylicocyclus nassatus]|uniref:Phlebovirus glycoprotein G2 fusion domain-containing protein n=1 Tax=Cylicocyclus nassatus TaxID=53992 RepID=A0AA36MAB2_CYLNA|nr:unnamed protein product [Cylicocyclus nassatus]